MVVKRKDVTFAAKLIANQIIMRRSDRRALMFVMVAALSVWGGMLLERYLAGRARRDILSSYPVKIVSGNQGKPKSGPQDDQENSSYETAEGHRTEFATYSGREAEVAKPFAFDPNTADSVSLLRLGFSPWQVKNIYKYRARGGRYRRVEDLKRLYGMTPELYERIAPYVRIDKRFQPYSTAELEAERHERELLEREHHDSIARRYPHQEKFEELVQLDLNSVDTTTLKRVPGIASYRARQIVRYRERLGGFISPAQLTEIEGFPADELRAWFKAEPGSVHRIDLNKASVQEMGRHPYIGFERARAIESYRRNQGQIKSLDDLSLLPAFTQEAMERMRPYVNIDD